MSRETAAERPLAESRRVERVYGVLARVYDAGFDWALGPGRQKAVSRLPVQPGQEVLEVGVGTGLSFPHYPKHARITGIDISEPMLDQARERLAKMTDAPQVRLQQMDARDLAMPDASFDHVVAPYVISVVPEPARVMREITRVCKPGGTVIVVNRFRTGIAAVGAVEDFLTPFSQWLGFRLDLPLDLVSGTAGLETAAVDRVNLLRMWHLIEMRRVA
jgi:phosphatidylethanolamine/phosphatidyl-N-methylethanolamine N-methyltransferase